MKKNNNTTINPDYKYFVVDTCDWLIVSGWEFKEDALDHLDELLKGTMTAVSGDYMVYTARYLKTLNKDYNNGIDINPFNPDNWLGNKSSDPDENYDLDEENKQAELMKKVSKMTRVNLQGHGMFSSRKDIKTAENYFYDILERTSKGSQMHLTTAFMVFWNTLAENYVIFKKDSESEVK